MHIYVVLCAGGYQGVVAAVAESDVVVNCAVVRQRRTLAFLVNVRGTFNAIRAAVSPGTIGSDPIESCFHLCLHETETAFHVTFMPSLCVRFVLSMQGILPRTAQDSKLKIALFLRATGVGWPHTVYQHGAFGHCNCTISKHIHYGCCDNTVPVLTQ
jgi:hypothetical protein